MDAGRTVNRPPRLPERILRACLPAGAVGLGIIGDLREEYYARLDAGRPARIWYSREALLLAARYLTRGRSARPRGARGALNISNDVRMALRSLRRAPATSAIIVLTVGAAMGASAIGFAFADFAIVRGLPVDDTARVVSVYGVDPRQADGRARLSLANFRDLRDRVTTLERFAALQTGTATLNDHGVPVSLDVVRATADLFAAMGVRPHAGRLFQPEDDVPGAPGVVILSHQYWRRVLGGDASALGRSLLIDGRERTVIGIAPANLEFGNLAMIDLWLPLEITAAASRTERSVTTMARLAAGTSLDAARAEVAAISKSLAMEFHEDNREWQATVLPITDVAYGRGYWVVITLFTASVTLVMLIACGNAASLVLARAMGRRREIALRAALGAGRFRLLRQALVEGALLSALSAAVALPLAELGLRVIRSVDAEPALQQLFLDSHEIGFIGIIALITPVIFSLLPTLSAIRLDLRTALQSGGLRAAGGSTRGRSALVAVQLVFAVTLLVAAGLAVRTGVNLAHISTGLHTENVLTFEINLESHDGRSPDRPLRTETDRSLVEDARDRLRRIPGVASVHVFEVLPILENERMVSIRIAGQTPAPGAPPPWAIINGADASALDALRVRLVMGRWLTELEERRGDPLALVSQAAASLYFGSTANAIGQALLVTDRGGERRVEIVGVVSDVLTSDLERGDVPRIWTALGDIRHPAFVVSTPVMPGDLASPVRREMAALLPMIPLEGLEPFDTALARYRASNLVMIGILAGFAILALILAATGLYGLINYTVGQRVPEFGTRFALGARPRDVLLLVARQVARLIGVGLALGLVAGLAVGQGMRGVLFGVSATDPVTIAGVIALMAVIAFVASIRPAIRAARVNLVDALRAE